jgi:hypothetical protein
MAAPAREDGARIGKKLVAMDFPRQEIVKALRRARLYESAATAESTLPDPVDDKTLNRFCTAQGLSRSMLTDLMGGSP